MRSLELRRLFSCLVISYEYLCNLFELRRNEVREQKHRENKVELKESNCSHRKFVHLFHKTDFRVCRHESYSM